MTDLTLKVSPLTLNLITQALAQQRDACHLAIQDLQSQVTTQLTPPAPPDPPA